MTNQYLPPLIEISDPDLPPANIKKLAEINDALNYPKRFFSFYKQDEFLSVVHHWIIKPNNKAPYLTTSQFDAPLEILPWFVDKLDFFMKSSVEGGLPANRIATDKELVGGDYFILGRAMSAGNERREGGYYIDNIERVGYGLDSDMRQSLLLSDSFLFEGGMLDLWKDLADKYKAGTL